MRELTCDEIELIGGGDFWQSLEEDYYSLATSIENWVSGLFSSGVSCGNTSNQLTGSEVSAVGQSCIAAGGSFTSSSSSTCVSLSATGLDEPVGGQLVWQTSSGSVSCTFNKK